MKKYSLKKGAFTLAETLITLSIIGVCAAMVVATLTVINPSDKANVSLAKKATVNFSNATRQILMLNSKSRKMTGIYKEGLSGDFCSDSTCFYNLVGEYLQITENITTPPENLKGEVYGKLTDGIVFGILFKPKAEDGSAKCTQTDTIVATPKDDTMPKDVSNAITVNGACGFIYYDTNGFAKPNREGQDQFALPIFKTGARVPTISDK